MFSRWCQELTYDAGDRFLLCSDGIHGMLPEEELIKLLKKRDVKLGVLVDNIATQVDETGRTTGGYHDNLTLAVVQTKTNSKIRNKMTKQTKQLFIGLITLFIMSFGLNIFQCSSGANSKGEDVKHDTVYKEKWNTKVLERTILQNYDTLVKEIKNGKIVRDTIIKAEQQ